MFAENFKEIHLWKKKSLKSGEELGNGIWLTGGFEKWIGQKCFKKRKKVKGEAGGYVVV